MSAADPSLSAFHDGERGAMAECYREHAGRVASAARKLVGPVDAETIVHEVFYRLLTNREMRESFRGGNLGAWLTQVAVRMAVDDLRRRRRETPLEAAHERAAADPDADARMLVERFQRERLPAEYAALFEARFLRQLTQRDAADALGMPRSTLVYQEQRIRELLEAFLLRE